MAGADLKKRKSEYIIVGVLVIVAIFMGLSRFKGKKKDDEVFSRTEFNKKWQEVEELERKEPHIERLIDYSLTAARSPFRSPFEVEESIEPVEEDIVVPQLNLQGMVWNSPRPQVVIDNKIYDINDNIDIGLGADAGPVIISNITKEGIYLKYKRKEYLVSPK